VIPCSRAGAVPSHCAWANQVRTKRLPSWRLVTRCRIALAATIASAGCYPAFIHSPRVQPGASLEIVSAVQVSVDTSTPDSTTRLAERFLETLQFAVGFRPPPGIDDLATRLAIGLGSSGVTAEVYFEMPRRWFGSTDAGLGVGLQHGPLSTVDPFVTAGHSMGSRYLYGAQGVARLWAPDGPRVRTAWVSTLGFMPSADGNARSFFLTLIFGPRAPEADASCLFFCAAHQTEQVQTFLMLGISVSASHRHP
jgi:hypothetical protein